MSIKGIEEMESNKINLTKKNLLENIKSQPNSSLPQPIGKPEFTDGTNWFALASENWVLDTIGLTSEKPCDLASTTNLDANYINGTSGVGAQLVSKVQGALLIDGITASVNQRVLVKDQQQAFQNGIYVVTDSGSSLYAWTLTRSTDFDTPSQMNPGGNVSVVEGLENQATIWMLTSAVTAVGTSALTFQKVNSGGVVSVLGTIDEVNVNSIAGVATVSLADNPIVPGSASMKLPAGTTAQRPTTVLAGMIRYNNGL